MFFKGKSPVPFIVVSLIMIVAGIVVAVATGGEGISGHWEVAF